MWYFDPNSTPKTTPPPPNPLQPNPLPHTLQPPILPPPQTTPQKHPTLLPPPPQFYTPSKKSHSRGTELLKAHNVLWNENFYELMDNVRQDAKSRRQRKGYHFPTKCVIVDLLPIVIWIFRRKVAYISEDYNALRIARITFLVLFVILKSLLSTDIFQTWMYVTN